VQGEHRPDAGKAAECGRGEVMPFKATERERDARKPERHCHCVCARHRSLRHQPAVNAEIYTQQIKRGEGRHRETDHDGEAHVRAWVHERQPEGQEAHGRHGFHGGQTRPPARQQRQPDPPANKRRSRNRHHGKASSLTRALSSQAA
jgi:hypothetical protein